MAKQELGPRQRKWVEALRSGEFKQGKGYLGTKNTCGWRHCVLGVACELAEVPHFDREYDEGTTTRLHRRYVDPHYSLTCAPQVVVNYFGLRNELGEFPKAIDVDGYNIPFTSLVGANDRGLSFKQLADLIEKHAGMIFKETK